MTGMSRSPEVAQAEAIQALTTRLEARGVEEALVFATEYVHDMVREGWRPRGPRYETPPVTNDGRRTPADRAPAEYAAAKAALKGVTVDAQD